MAGIVSISDLVLGSPVVGRDGGEVGVVNEVVQNPSFAPGSAGQFYFEADRGGVLGIGATHLYIPVEMVQSVSSEHGVMLSCTAQEANEKYGRRPDEGT